MQDPPPPVGVAISALICADPEPLTLPALSTDQKVIRWVPLSLTLFTVSDSGTHLITFWSVDNAGRVSGSGSAQINAEIATPTGGGGSCINVTLISDGSGQLFYTLDGINWQPYNDGAGLNVCPVSSTSATDLSYGYSESFANIEPVQTLFITIDRTYAAPTTIPGLIELVRQYRASGDINEQAMADTLVSILDGAQAASNANEQDGYLRDFKSKVLAQSGKKISATAAEVLAHAAEYLVNHN